ncbi:SprT-like family-domain-containing protein [Pyronema omphalodes]|nr:SprT-like family-domain-containing protein [Pyronema omphalodes]
MLTDDEAATLAITSFCTTSSFSTEQLKAAEYIITALSDPAPFIEDLPALFAAYDVLYFRSLLQSTTTLTWSKRMTSCAGVCALQIDKVTKRPLSPRQCAVRLSEPLLKFRPRSDTINTLLHECIHAYLFIAGGRHVRGDDPTGHGVAFQTLAGAINHHGGYEITTMHTFHEQVRSYQTHVWQCTGSCSLLPPYFGIVRRAMNRAPGPSDSWYEHHQETCGGEWIKVSEPERKSKKDVEKKSGQKNKLDSWLRKGDGMTDNGKSESSGRGTDTVEEKVGRKATLMGGGETVDDVREFLSDSDVEIVELPDASKNRPSSGVTGRDGLTSSKATSVKKRPLPPDNIPVKRPKPQPVVPTAKMVECPVCSRYTEEDNINTHLDTVHGF